MFTSFKLLLPSPRIFSKLYCSTVQKPQQLTLAIIKPHICKDPQTVQEITDIITGDGFTIVQSEQMDLSRKRAEEFYGEHRGKFFYERLVSFMSSGEILVMILARENAIQRWRDLMGPTKVFRTIIEHPDTIRGKYGLTDTRNATHGSDSTASVMKEIEFFFPKFDFDSWPIT